MPKRFRLVAPDSRDEVWAGLVVLRPAVQHERELAVGDEPLGHLGETGLLSQGVLAGRKTLRIRHINGM
jgi:hypothetical protein